jgi:mRNA interferase YafQ
MLEIFPTARFKKDLKKSTKRGKDIDKLQAIILELRLRKTLPSRNRDHELTGNYKGRRECHIEPDWLLVYKHDGERLILERTGSHADLFE